MKDRAKLNKEVKISSEKVGGEGFPLPGVWVVCAAVGVCWLGELASIDFVSRIFSFCNSKYM